MVSKRVVVTEPVLWRGAMGAEQWRGSRDWLAGSTDKIGEQSGQFFAEGYVSVECRKKEVCSLVTAQS